MSHRPRYVARRDLPRADPMTASELTACIGFCLLAFLLLFAALDTASERARLGRVEQGSLSPGQYAPAGRYP